MLTVLSKSRPDAHIHSACARTESGRQPQGASSLTVCSSHCCFGLTGADKAKPDTRGHIPLRVTHSLKGFRGFCHSERAFAWSSRKQHSRLVIHAAFGMNTRGKFGSRSSQDSSDQPCCVSPFLNCLRCRTWVIALLALVAGSASISEREKKKTQLPVQCPGPKSSGQTKTSQQV